MKHKNSLAASYFILFLVNPAYPMLVTVPPQQAMRDQQDFQISLGSRPILQPRHLIIRLRNSEPVAVMPTVIPQASTPISLSASSRPSPALNALTHLNKEVVEQFNKAAPFLAVCAFAVQYTQIFSQRPQPPIPSHVLANLAPAEQRLHTILQENEQIKKQLKSLSWHSWQALFSLAMLNPQFNKSYEALETENDVRNLFNILNPTLRASALHHLTNRSLSKAKSFACSQLSKFLVFAYRCISPNTAHPSATKTLIDLLAITSIYSTISPQIVNYCAQPNSIVATMTRENALRAYNYLPETMKNKLLIIKNWWIEFSAHNQH